MASAVMSRAGADLSAVERSLSPAAHPPSLEPRTSAPIHCWDLVAGEYGPGTRFVLFTAGCPLRCVYCPTPELWDERSGRRVDVRQVLAQVDRYRPLFDLTGGGLTLSGGEPLLHGPFVEGMVLAARREGIHVTLATPGIAGDGVDDVALGAIDLVLLDLKAHGADAFRRATGVPAGASLRFARRVAALGRPIRVRVVVVPGVTDGRADVEGLAAFLAELGTVERVDVVPFDRQARAGWVATGREYPLELHPGPTREALARVRDAFARRGLDAS